MKSYLETLLEKLEKVLKEQDTQAYEELKKVLIFWNELIDKYGTATYKIQNELYELEEEIEKLKEEKNE